MALSSSYLPPAGMKGLDSYKYQSGVYSWLDNTLNPFWAWIAEQLPRTIAPNAITLLGTAFLGSMGVLQAIYDPNLQGIAPRWVYFWYALCIWMYQTLDAVDGKQARRTGSSSPLGQLFDHGCDALGTMPLGLAVCGVLGLGASSSTVLMCATIQIPFLMAQFEEHFAHSMRTQVANFGVTEGQYLEAGVMLLTGIMGPKVWDMELPMTSFLKSLPGNPQTASALTLRMASIYSGCFFPVLLGLASLQAVWSTKSAPVAYLKLVPILSLELFVLYTSMTPASDSVFSQVFHKYPVLFMTVFGIYFTRLVSELIIATVAKIEYPAIHLPGMAPLYVLILLDLLGDLTVNMVAIYGLYLVLGYLHYVISISQQIAEHLNIKVLSLGPRYSNGKKQD
jgi:phosphatidylglycerophosphate synthase